MYGTSGTDRGTAYLLRRAYANIFAASLDGRSEGETVTTIRNAHWKWLKLGFGAALIAVAAGASACRHCDRGGGFGVCRVLPEKEVQPLLDVQEEVDRLFNEEVREPLGPPRACRPDAYFIDVPLAADPLWTSTRFLGRVEADLTKRARYGWPTWFCRPGERCPNREDITVEVRSVLQSAEYAKLREDGHLRFFRARFLNKGRPLKLTEASQCEVLSAVRAHFLKRALESADKGLASLGNFPSDAIRVGRECDALGAQDPTSKFPELFTESRQNWHKVALQVLVDGESAARKLRGADIALIDAGVNEQTRKNLGITVRDVPGAIAHPPSDPGVTQLHPHGISMAKLLRDVSPATRIQSYRAIDGYGIATIAGVAKALDAAIADAVTARTPRVINMSLGWSPSKGRDVLRTGINVNGGQCSTVEHGIGESVRYLLYLARQIDRSPNKSRPRISVVAAIGNRPFTPSRGGQIKQLPPKTQGRLALKRSMIKPSTAAARKQAVSDSDDRPLRRCTVPKVVNDWLYPAQWALQPSCRFPNDKEVLLVWPVGGIDSRLKQGTMSQRLVYPPLSAPGDFVFVRHDKGDAEFALQPTVPAPNAPYTPNLQYPRFISGTSAATALVTAIAAQGQAQLVASGKPPLTSDALHGKLLLTARVLPSPGKFIPSLARLSRHLEDGLRPGPARITTEGLREPSNFNLFPNAVPVEIEPQLAVKMDNLRNYREWVPKVGAPAIPEGPDRFEMGAAGPQPPIPPCPSCTNRPSSPRIRLDLVLAAEFRGQKFSDPVVVFEIPTGEFYLVPLPTDRFDWRPGRHVQLVVPWPKNIRQAGAKVAFGIFVERNGVRTFELSVLEHQDNPDAAEH